MKRLILWLMLAAFAVSGCSTARQSDPYRVDTVVLIPVDPTDPPTEAPTEAPTEQSTDAPAEAPTEAPTEPKETTAKKTTTTTKKTTSSSSSSSKKTSSSSSSKNNSTSKKEPAATQPPKTTEPPKATEPPAMTAPETIPAETAAAETVPDETAAPVTTPVETEPPTEEPTDPPYNPGSYGVGGLEYGLVEELNASRVSAELPELSLDGYLSGIAYLRAMEASASWSHTRPDGRNYTSALSDYGYGHGAAAELMVYVPGGADAAAIATKWMNSKSHSENILSGSFTTAGVGVYSAGGMTYVVCLLVG